MAGSENEAVELQPLFELLSRRLKVAVLKHPKTRVLSTDQTSLGAVVNVEDELLRAGAELYPSHEDLELELYALADLPTPLIGGTYWAGGGLGFSLDLLDLPGSLAYLTVPSDRLDFDLSMRAIASLPKPVRAASMGEIVPQLLVSNPDETFWTPPDWTENLRPDLISRDTFRLFLSQADDDAWQSYVFEPALPHPPSNRKEFVAAYMEHAYSEKDLSGE